ncbi:MAG: hypothetical protein H0W78_19835 [Planctomycetes bacterium]|nr:hypothetical protein [Planctomycetota bacterium]
MAKAIAKALGFPMCLNGTDQVQVENDDAEGEIANEHHHPRAGYPPDPLGPYVSRPDGYTEKHHGEDMEHRRHGQSRSQRRLRYQFVYSLTDQ